MASNSSLPQTPAPSGFPAQMTFRPVAVKNARPPQPYLQPAALVEPNGHTLLNRSATNMVHDLAKALNLAPREYVLVLAAGEAGYFAAKPAPLGTPGAAKVSTYKDGTLGFQIYELFGEDPELRPLVRKSCVPFLTKNQDGETVMVIGVKVGQDNPVQPRTTKKNSGN